MLDRPKNISRRLSPAKERAYLSKAFEKYGDRENYKIPQNHLNNQQKKIKSNLNTKNACGMTMTPNRIYSSKAKPDDNLNKTPKNIRNFNHYLDNVPTPLRKHTNYAEYKSVSITLDLFYIGPFKNGVFEGKGQIISKRGDVLYDGDFENGVYHGYGRLKNYDCVKQWDAGDRSDLRSDIYKRYFGIEKNNYVKDIIAKRGLLDVNFNSSNWESFEGYFSKGEKHGVGKLKLKDGRKFEGEFENGVVSGYGILRYFGDRVVGKWKDNILVCIL